jgi:hypothetical protein
MTKERNSRYHADEMAQFSSDEELEKWGTDPDCVESDACAKILAERIAKQVIKKSEGCAAKAAKRWELQDNPFDPRTEVSADARHITKQLWILFVLLPFLASLVWLGAFVATMK